LVAFESRDVRTDDRFRAAHRRRWGVVCAVAALTNHNEISKAPTTERSMRMCTSHTVLHGVFRFARSHYRFDTVIR